MSEGAYQEHYGNEDIGEEEPVSTSIDEKMKIEEVLSVDKVVKHSVRFACEGREGAPVPTIYIKKPWFEKHKKIKLTIEAYDETVDKK